MQFAAEATEISYISHIQIYSPAVPDNRTLYWSRGSPALHSTRWKGGTSEELNEAEHSDDQLNQSNSSHHGDEGSRPGGTSSIVFNTCKDLIGLDIETDNSDQ